MKGYVYMIDYAYEYSEALGCYLEHDQCECEDKQEMLKQLGYILEDEGIEITRVKLVKDDDRWVEKDISKTLQDQVNKIINKRRKS